MTRSQSEAIAKTIIAAVEPLATKDDLKNLETKVDDKIAGLKEQMATKADIAAVKTSVVSIKVWVLSGVLVTVGSMLTLAFGVVI